MIDSPSRLRLIRKVAVLVRTFATLDLIIEEKLCVGSGSGGSCLFIMNQMKFIIINR